MPAENEITVGEAAEPNELRLLLLEDDPRLAELVRHVLADSAPEFDVEHVGRLSTALARLVRQPFSLIVTDLDLPDSRGPATVRHLQRAAPNMPLVVLSGEGELDVALECIREGADEFLVKGTLGFQALGRLIRLALERRNRLMAPRESATAQSRDEADRTTLESIGRHLLQVADRVGLYVNVLFLTADRPGPGIPGWPDSSGDVTAVLRRALRRCDLVARLQGDEWAVILVMQHADPRSAATRLAEALRAAVAGSRIHLGIASYHPDGPESIDELIARARQGLHSVHA
jgi:PleD family two-component response regulator